MIVKDFVTIVAPMLVKRMDNFVIPSMKFHSKLWSLDIAEFDIQVANILPKSLRIKVYDFETAHAGFGDSLGSSETKLARQKSVY